MLRELSNVTGRKLKVIYGVKNVGEIRIEEYVLSLFFSVNLTKIHYEIQMRFVY